jgi:hypothetical protein
MMIMIVIIITPMMVLSLIFFVQLIVFKML